jgi:hypothetical protein
MKKRRMHQVDVESNENDDIVISQNHPDEGTHHVVISLDQVDFLHQLLVSVKEEIESRSEGAEEDDEEEEVDLTRRGPRGGR